CPTSMSAGAGRCRPLVGTPPNQRQGALVDAGLAPHGAFPIHAPLPSGRGRTACAPPARVRLSAHAAGVGRGAERGVGVRGNGVTMVQPSWTPLAPHPPPASAGAGSSGTFSRREKGKSVPGKPGTYG